jgi:hypothetical protein
MSSFLGSPFDEMTRFVMEVDATPKDVELAESIRWHACVRAALAIDYWSWPKKVANNSQHRMRLLNGVALKRAISVL